MSFLPFVPWAAKAVEAMMEGILPKKGKYISQSFRRPTRESIER